MSGFEKQSLDRAVSAVDSLARIADALERGAAALERLAPPFGPVIRMSDADSELGILIEELDIGPRVYNCLKRSGLNTVEDVMRRERDGSAAGYGGLKAIPNFGERSYGELFEALAIRGLDLSAADEWKAPDER